MNSSKRSPKYPIQKYHCETEYEEACQILWMGNYHHNETHVVFIIIFFQLFLTSILEVGEAQPATHKALDMAEQNLCGFWSRKNFLDMLK